MHLTHHEQTFELLADHAVFLPEHQCLVVSDLHLGKAGAFRSHGLAVPEGDDARDLERLQKLIEHTGAKRVVIAGDLFHSPSAAMTEVMERLKDWCLACPAEFTLVIGNHDRRTLPGGTLPFESTKVLQIGSIEIIHDPADVSPDSTFSLCGHLHPVIRIRDGRRTSIRSACFWLSENMLTLPSFGSFTGGQIIHPATSDRIFIPIRDKVAEVPSSCWK